MRGNCTYQSKNYREIGIKTLSREAVAYPNATQTGGRRRKGTVRGRAALPILCSWKSSFINQIFILSFLNQLFQFPQHFHGPKLHFGKRKPFFPEVFQGSPKMVYGVRINNDESVMGVVEFFDFNSRVLLIKLLDVKRQVL